MTKYYLAIAATMFAFACNDKGGDTADTSDTDTDTDSDTDSDPSVSVSWGGSSISVSISGGPGAYWFGMAEVGGSCGDWCWTGEDCIWGFTNPDSGNVVGPFCHDADDTGTTLTYGGNCDDVQVGTTCFTGNSFSGDVDYYLDSDNDTRCWVGGTGSGSYFSGLGCDTISF